MYVAFGPQTSCFFVERYFNDVNLRIVNYILFFFAAIVFSLFSDEGSSRLLKSESNQYLIEHARKANQTLFFRFAPLYLLLCRKHVSNVNTKF